MLLDRSGEASSSKESDSSERNVCLYLLRKRNTIAKSGIRDHCPHCLRSRHVDIVPGDRAAKCRGRMDPIQFELIGGVVWIEYQCSDCPHTYRVRAHDEDRLPHSCRWVTSEEFNMSVKKFEQRVLNVIKRSQLWTPGECVTLAVSGGVDSMVILDVLAKTQRSHMGISKWSRLIMVSDRVCCRSCICQ